MMVSDHGLIYIPFSSRRGPSNLRPFALAQSEWTLTAGSERGHTMPSENSWALEWTTTYRYLIRNTLTQNPIVHKLVSFFCASDWTWSFVNFFQLGKWIHQRRVWTGTTYAGWFSHHEGHENLSLWKGRCARKAYLNPCGVLVSLKVSMLSNFCGILLMNAWTSFCSSIFTTLLHSRLGPRPEASSETRGWTWESFNNFFWL